MSYINNSAIDFPLKLIVRDNISEGNPATISATQQKIFLDAKVIGARVGKYYKIEWVGNGFTSATYTNPNYQILVSEYESINYSTNSSLGKKDLIILNNDTPGIARTGIEKVEFYTFGNTIKFELVIDYSKITGNSHGLNSPTGFGFNSIIDPVCYEYGYDPNKQKIQLQYTSKEIPSVKVRSNYTNQTENLACWEFGQFGSNPIFHLYRFSREKRLDYNTPYKTSEYTLTTSSTDFIGPYNVSALGNVGTVSQDPFCGGVHGMNSVTTTVDEVNNPSTAAMESLRVEIDGVEVKTTGNYLGDEIDIFVCNKIMAKNTVTLDKRYVIKEYVNYKFLKGGKLKVIYKSIALEDVKIHWYYGLQCHPSTSLFGTVLFYNANKNTHTQISTGARVESGDRKTYPFVNKCEIKDTAGKDRFIISLLKNCNHINITSQNIPLCFTETTKKMYFTQVNNCTLYKGNCLEWEGLYEQFINEI